MDPSSWSRRGLRFAFALSALWSTAVLAGDSAAPRSVRFPMTCSRGPGATFDAQVTMSTSAEPGSLVTVRIDSVSSGTISHWGLFSIHDMTTDYLVPAGTSYVEGSARVVPDTGTANVRASARVWHDAGVVHLALPAHVEKGASYTPPSLEFTVKIEATPDSELDLQFVHYEVKADAFLVGTVVTRCDPTLGPYTLARLRVTGAPADAGAGHE